MRRISILGLVAVCAMAFAAVVASAAGAATAVAAGNTAFTCVASKGTLNADCEIGSSGTSGHVAIAENENTELKLTKLSNSTFKWKFGLATLTMTTTGVNCVSCTAHNQTDATTKVMDVTGSGGEVEFTGVTVSTAGCEAEGLPGGLRKVRTKPLKFTTLSPTVATLEPVSGTVMAEFNFTGASCPLTFANPVKIEGHMDGTLSGAHVTFNTVAGMLNVGSQTFFVVGEMTASAKKSTDGSFTAVSLTAA